MQPLYVLDIENLLLLFVFLFFFFLIMQPNKIPMSNLSTEV